ncbi:hypothetical protein [Deinococcus radiotolerans]|uniref:YubB ferredoxin-like domain-containing protein n=1 Tax=Deinococcus radiotolerans TaxID=1309407 RepID=A0ABQ2FLS0_9DEIO|nr:hypothetical protein [Deinococcus radiotolerans]GGL06878.1 hypothetical protein GCM10010844_27110 [Deinococcus radiotolerans]
MTNWCQNRLEVSGADDLLAAWRAAQQGPTPVYGRGRAPTQALTFSAQVPVPAAVLARGYGVGGLHDLQRAVAITAGGEDPTPDVPLDGASWQAVHWGSSRDAAEVTVIVTPGRLTLDFVTAWAAPVPWLEATAARWPALRFELWTIEPGNEVYVHARLEAGRTTLLEERAPTPEDLLAWGYDPDDA